MSQTSDASALSDTLRTLLVFDLPVLVAALMALVACGTLGNWLVLRKESMTGDAIAHSVLPGLVGGFLVVGRHSVVAMFAGAAIAGVAAILLAGWVRRQTKLESGAALGIVFTAFFAFGVAMLEMQGARQVDLDPGCVLFGALETLFLVVPHGGHWISGVPREVWTLTGAALLAVLFSVAFWKELAALAFDREHAHTTGVSPRALDQLMLCVTSVAIVASFEAVGSVLVISLLACPSLLAAPHTVHLRGRFAMSLGVGSLLTVLGYGMAAYAPNLFGTSTALNAAGMIATLLALAVPVSYSIRALLNRRMA